MLRLCLFLLLLTSPAHAGTDTFERCAARARSCVQNACVRYSEMLLLCRMDMMAMCEKREQDCLPLWLSENAKDKFPTITTEAECKAGGISDLRNNACLAPRRDQSDSAWCYAYAASEIISFELCKPVSAPAIALSFIEKAMRQTKLEGFGNINLSIIAAAMEGLCPEADMPSTIKEDGEPAIDIVKLYSSFSRKREGKGARQESLGLEPHLAFPHLKKIDVMKAYWSDDVDAAFALKRKACKNPYKPYFKLETDESKDARTKLAFLEKWIATRPVAFGANSMKIPVEILDGGPVPWNAAHAVTFVARVWHKARKQCGFLVKDSGNSNSEEYTFISRETLYQLMKWDPTSTMTALVKVDKLPDPATLRVAP